MASIELQFDFDNMGLAMVIPWSLPQVLQDYSSESQAKFKQIFTEEVGGS